MELMNTEVIYCTVMIYQRSIVMYLVTLALKPVYQSMEQVS